MRIKYFGFILLIWIPGGLHAQNDTKPCPAPTLDDGFFVPEHEVYPHGTQLQYSCFTRLKPAAEGWWATSTCQRGVWSPNPQCIDENACLPPIIVNGKYKDSQAGWYKNGDVIRVKCDRGYEHKDYAATAECTNGTWSSLPVCEKSSSSCNEPPKIPHAVVVHQQYEELFPADSQVQYECKEGYTVEETYRNPIICMSGAWTEGPSCRIRPNTAEVGTHGGGATSAGSGTQQGGQGSRPGTGQGGSGTRGGDATSAGGGKKQEIGGGRGSSTNSHRDPVSTRVATINCGSHPVIPNADVVQENQMFLKYKCNAFYTLVGEATVVCHSDGTWSRLPICKEAFCVMRPGVYHRGFELRDADFIKEGERKTFSCIWDYFELNTVCTNGRLLYSLCCSRSDHQRRVCPAIYETA